MAPLNVGDQAPDFNLRSTEEDSVKLSDLRGSTVVLAFFPAAFTGVCQTELCTFRDSLSNFNDMGSKVFGISVDPPFSQAEFAKQNDLNFPLLSDSSGATVDAYGVTIENLAGIEGYNAAQRSVFVISADGKVSWSWISDSPLNEPNYEDVKAAAKAA